MPRTPAEPAEAEEEAEEGGALLRIWDRIRRGELALEDEEGREIILSYLNKGDFIGEMGLFMPMPRRSVMVRTRSACELAEISYQKLEQLFESDLRSFTKEILYALGRQLTERLAATDHPRLQWHDRQRVRDPAPDLALRPLGRLDAFGAGG